MATSIEAVCSQVAPYAAAGTVLRRVVHWHRYAQAEHGGHLWVVKTRQDWADDTGLTVRQVRRAFSALARAGLIVAEQHYWGSDGKNPNWVRPTDHVLDAVADAPRAARVARQGAARSDRQGAARVARRGATVQPSLHQTNTKDSHHGGGRQIQMPEDLDDAIH